MSLCRSIVCVFIAGAVSVTAFGQTPRPSSSAAPLTPVESWRAGEPPASALVEKIQGELSPGNRPPEFSVDASIPHGELMAGTIATSKVYPGSEHYFRVYVPAQYDPARPACLLLVFGGIGADTVNLLDHLIARGDMPITIAVGVAPGTIWKDPPVTPKRQAFRFNRSYEFDSMNDHLPDYILNELLPAVQRMKTKDGRLVQISKDGNDHAAMGGSTNGIAAFTLAWRRPDQFRRIFCIIGTFVSMRGGNEYPVLIRKTEPKPVRVFLEDGAADEWNPLFGSWFAANLNVEAALSFAGYDVAHAWGTHGHDGQAANGVLPDVLRWLWRDYPAPITAGTSRNSTLVSLLADQTGWQKVDRDFVNVCGLAANAQGEVWATDPGTKIIYRLGADKVPQIVANNSPAITSCAFGPEGNFYGVVPDQKKVIAFDPAGTSRTVADNIKGHSILVTHDGTLFVSEPGPNSDAPSNLWQIKSTGEKTVVDAGLSNATGISFCPDASLFFAAEKSTQWVYSYLVAPGAGFTAKQPFYWLHQTDIPDNSGAEALAVDKNGELYVATTMGVQICDQNGRVRAIMPLPSPSGPVVGLCFGGSNFDTLFVTDGKHVFWRKLKVPGVPPWSPPIPYPSEGYGQNAPDCLWRVLVGNDRKHLLLPTNGFV